jgi:hypothetical protein
MRLRPIERRNDAGGKERNIDSKFSGRDIDQFFPLREKIQQQRAQPRLLEHFCHRTIARAVPATPASVRKDHESMRIGRQADVSIEGDASDIEAHRPWSRRLGWDAHDVGLVRFGSG